MRIPGAIGVRIEGAIRRRTDVRDVADRDIVFIMPVYRDADVAGKALARLRRHYPDARVALISDGDAEFPGDRIRELFRVEYVRGENLYAMDHGGEMIHRILDLYMAAPARWLVRLDSDARMDRRFRRLPGAPGLYGTIGKRSGTVQGGCILLPHESAAHLHMSEVFLRPELRDPAQSWGQFSTEENLQRKIDENRMAYDKALHWGCVEEGVPIRAFPEIYSVWKPSPAVAAGLANRAGRHAIVHPDKTESE